ncbi:MAG: damage-control phosphatase ARMT1 family protein [Candidatus Thorarchaeota archaeon]
MRKWLALSERIEVPLIPDCGPCIMDSLKILVPLLTPDENKQADYFALAFRILSEGYEKRVEPAPLSIGLYQKLYVEAGNMDPYAEIKRVSTEAALKALPTIDRIIEPLEGVDRFRACLSASITGNVIDFNTGGHEPNLENLVTVFNTIQIEGLAIDDSDQLWRSLQTRPGKLLFLADNAGEHILDIPLLRLLKDMGWSVTFIVKGQAMINDVTMEEVLRTEIEELTEVADSGAWAHGVPLHMVSKEFLQLVSNSDIVISKGQANIETFPEIQRETGVETYYITRAKCPHISQAVGAKKDDSVVLRRPNST